MLDPTKVPVKIRVEKVNNQMKVFVTDDNADSENWRSWVDLHLPEIFQEGFFGFTSGNAGGIRNDIDLTKVIVTDLDPNSPYLQFADSKTEIRYFTLNDEEEKEKEEPTTAKDIFHMKKKVNKYSETGKGIKFEGTDSQEDILYKIYENIHLFNLNLKEMMGEARLKLMDPSSRLEIDSMPDLMTDMKYTQETIEYIGQNMLNVNGTLHYLASGRYLQEAAQNQQAAQQNSLPDLSTIGEIIYVN